MAHILIMPRQGNTVESCILVSWKVKDGDSVDPDTPVCDVETDKATFEVPAGTAGTVLKLLWTEGDDVPVLKPIAVIGKPGEDWSAALASADKSAAEALAPAPETPAQQTAPAPAEASALKNSGPGLSGQAVSPRARRLAEREGLPLTGIGGTGPGGRIIERDILAALQNAPALTAAAKAAGGRSGPLPAVGTGIAGRVSAADLAAAAVSPASGLKDAGGQNAPPDFGEGAIAESPIKGIRKVISDRMLKSLAETAQLTLNSSAPALRMQKLRERLKSSAESLGLSKVSVNDLILFAVSRTLPQFPYMNAHKVGEVLKTFERVHLGMAVDTPRGLMVPVIRNANLLSLRQISGEAKRLAGACQTGIVKPDELSGSTFTVTNLGSLGITSFTPILNAPEIGILGVCGVELKPVPGANGETAFAPHIGFSLTINHQVVDGAPAARFLKALGDAVSDIDLLLAL
jgi:pyruvate dehydrogenase E2 component (dihydrolipoamide acetyltransferase)